MNLEHPFNSTSGTFQGVTLKNAEYLSYLDSLYRSLAPRPSLRETFIRAFKKDIPEDEKIWISCVFGVLMAVQSDPSEELQEAVEENPILLDHINAQPFNEVSLFGALNAYLPLKLLLAYRYLHEPVQVDVDLYHMVLEHSLHRKLRGTRILCYLALGIKPEEYGSFNQVELDDILAMVEANKDLVMFGR